MSSQLFPAEKSQQLYNVDCDSGFVSRACSDCDTSSYSSMKVAAHSQSPVNPDHVKDLQADFAGINDFDAVPKTTSSQVACNVGGFDRAQMQMQLMQYFEQDDDGDTQLHISVYTSITEPPPAGESAGKIALWLIDNAPQADLLDIKNDECLTALHVAAMNRRPEIVRRLVLAGANTKITTPSLYQPWTSRGNAAIHMACEANDCESVRALTEPLSPKELGWLACSGKAPPVLGQDLELRNYDGVTPMHTAIKRGNLEIVKQLVKVGAKVNTVDPCSGFTSLHLAINHNRRDIVEYMATYHQSCVNVPTRFGMYTYEIALNVDKQLADDLVRWGAAPIVGESDSDSYSESDSEESLDDEPKQYSPSMMTYSEMYQAPATATLIIT